MDLKSILPTMTGHPCNSTDTNKSHRKLSEIIITDLLMSFGEETGESDYIDELLSFAAQDAGFPQFHKKSVGSIVVTSIFLGEYEMEMLRLRQGEAYLVLSIHNEPNDFVRLKCLGPFEDEEETFLEVTAIQFKDLFRTTAPRAAKGLWKKYQQRHVTEGIWINDIPGELLKQMNHLFLHQSLCGVIYPTKVEIIQKEDREEDGGRGKRRVDIVSEISDLNRQSHPGIYSALEAILEEMLPNLEAVWRKTQNISFEPYWEAPPPHSPQEERAVIPFESFSNLQVFVDFIRPVSPPTAWRYGNEDIVMTAILFFQSPVDQSLSSEANATMERLVMEFKRMFTDEEALRCFGWEGIEELPERPDWLNDMLQLRFKPLGTVSLSTNQYLIFPSCYAHRRISTLRDSQPTGHESASRRDNSSMRTLVISFVDPCKRISSRQNR
jgi:hypothetical protein